MVNKLWCAWFCGFVDGEGCFQLQPNMRSKNHSVIGIHFTLGLVESDVEILKEIQNELGCGKIYRDDYVGDTNSRPKQTFTITSLKDSVGILIPTIDSYGLKTNKRLEYEIWREFCVRWLRESRQHPDPMWGIKMSQKLRETRLSLKSVNKRRPF